MASRGMEGSSLTANRVKAGTGYYRELTAREGEEGKKGVRLGAINNDSFLIDALSKIF